MYWGILIIKLILNLIVYKYINKNGCLYIGYNLLKIVLLCINIEYVMILGMVYVYFYVFYFL